MLKSLIGASTKPYFLLMIEINLYDNLFCFNEKD